MSCRWTSAWVSSPASSGLPAPGKTTLLKTMLGAQPVYGGEIRLFGQPIQRLPAGSIGYVPQLESVDWSFPVTVEQVILMGLYATERRLLPWASKQEKAKVHDLALRLGIHDCLHHHIVDISGGQQQRAFLGRALISNPKLLILDEPTAGVDIKTQHDVLHLLGDAQPGGHHHRVDHPRPERRGVPPAVGDLLQPGADRRGPAPRDLHRAGT